MREYLLFASLFVFSVAADQLTKIWARAALRPHRRVITVIAATSTCATRRTRAAPSASCAT